MAKSASRRFINPGSHGVQTNPGVAGPKAKVPMAPKVNTTMRKVQGK